MPKRKREDEWLLERIFQFIFNSFTSDFINEEEGDEEKEGLLEGRVLKMLLVTE
jgi:hypothetical protein